jgi:hypothetical protein
MWLLPRCSARPPIAAGVWYKYKHTTHKHLYGRFPVQGVRFGGLKSAPFGLELELRAKCSAEDPRPTSDHGLGLWLLSEARNLLLVAPEAPGAAPGARGVSLTEQAKELVPESWVLSAVAVESGGRDFFSRFFGPTTSGSAVFARSPCASGAAACYYLPAACWLLAAGCWLLAADLVLSRAAGSAEELQVDHLRSHLRHVSYLPGRIK